MGEKLDLVNDRENHGIRVELYAKDEDALVVVSGRSPDESFELQADKASAKDVFEHPFAVKAFREDQASMWRPSPELQPTEWDLALDDILDTPLGERLQMYDQIRAQGGFTEAHVLAGFVRTTKEHLANVRSEQLAA